MKHHEQFIHNQHNFALMKDKAFDLLNKLEYSEETEFFMAQKNDNGGIEIVSGCSIGFKIGLILDLMQSIKNEWKFFNGDKKTVEEFYERILKSDPNLNSISIDDLLNSLKK